MRTQRLLASFTLANLLQSAKLGTWIFIIVLLNFPVLQAAAAADKWKEEAAKSVQSEPSVVEAMFPENATSSFWVSMRDDGSRRDGFAQYLCLVLSDNGMPEGEFLVIRIWDAYSLSNGEFQEIGRNDCKRN